MKTRDLFENQQEALTEQSIFADSKRRAEAKIAKQNKPTRKIRKTMGTTTTSTGRQKK